MILPVQRTFLQRHYFSKPEIERTLTLSCLFSAALSLARIGYTGQWTFIFLNWNLFLAWIPYGLSKKLLQEVSWIETTWMFVIIFTGWLLFIPNAFYILTDLFHLTKNAAVPLWFDLALILSFAWNGLLLGVLSVRHMEKITAVKWQIRQETFFIYPVMFLNAFGVYIGRYLRFNSWDVVANPFGLAQDIVYLLVHPLRNRFDWSMIVCYAVLMTLMYTAIKRISKAVL
jgi:uncharacterized membrane protein